MKGVTNHWGRSSCCCWGPFGANRSLVQCNISIYAVASAHFWVAWAFRVAVTGRRRHTRCVIGTPAVVALDNGEGVISIAFIMTPTI